MKKILKIAVTILIAASASACLTPQPVRDASQLMASHTVTYKTEITTFQQTSNLHRTASATLLSNRHINNRALETQMKRNLVAWKVSGNKSAMSAWTTLRDYGEELDADYVSEASLEATKTAELQKRFGKLDFSTKDLEGAAKAYERLAKDQGLDLDKETLANLLEIVNLFAKQHSQKAAGHLDTAQKKLEKSDVGLTAATN